MKLKDGITLSVVWDRINEDNLQFWADMCEEFNEYTMDEVIDGDYLLSWLQENRDRVNLFDEFGLLIRPKLPKKWEVEIYCEQESIDNLDDAEDPNDMLYDLIGESFVSRSARPCLHKLKITVEQID